MLIYCVNLSLNVLMSAVKALAHLAIICSKLTTETLEQGVKCVLVSLLLTLNIFQTLF